MGYRVCQLFLSHINILIIGEWHSLGINSWDRPKLNIEERQLKKYLTRKMYVYEIFFMDTSPTTLLALDSLPDLFIIINTYSRLRIDVGQKINIEPGKYGKTNK